MDEITYYAGLPIKQRPVTKDVIMSKTNFRGCINVITFNKKALKLSPTDLKSKDSDIKFHGKYIKGCSIGKPKFLKSFKSSKDQLEIYSHVNRNMFRAEFYYRTYLQTGNILISRSPTKASSLSLTVKDNKLQLLVNVTKKDSISIGHFDANADDGVWKKIQIHVTPKEILFGIEKIFTRYQFNSSKIVLDFPNKIVFGGEYNSKPGFTGCIKDVYLGNELTSITKVMNLGTDLKYEEEQCKMKDYCLPSQPCANKGRCIQKPTKAVCDCQGTGFTGTFCQQPNTHQYQASCTGYFKQGYHNNGIFTIKPGHSKPFEVHCDMKNKNGPKTIIKTNIGDKKYVFKSESFDKNYHYHQVTYEATKSQIADLIATSQTCRQYVRYDCIASTLLSTYYKTERSSSLGLRWYSRKGFPRHYWHGDSKTASKKSCRCGLEGNCISPDVLCNCDVRDQKFHYDDGFINEKDDLPISKIRVSIQRTNPRSSFHIGDLECSDNVNISNIIPSYVPDLATDKNGVVLHEPTTPYSNQTEIDVSKKKTKNFVLIDTKLLYGIIIAVILLISLLILILILKRRLCCCYYENKAKPQIVEIYKDVDMATHRNNNKNSFQLADDSSAHFNVSDVTLSVKRGMSSSYPVSNSESSVSTIDPSRYYQHNISDSDTLSLHQSIIPPEPPVRTTLKIKKELAQKRQSDGSHLSSGSETSVAKNNNKSTPPSNDSILSKSYNSTRDYICELEDGISPLKQKILEMSTAKQRLRSGELYFHHQDSNATMQSLLSSSSDSSSKESDLNTDDDTSNDLSELLPINRAERSRSVRFTDEEKKDFYSRMYQAVNNGSKPTKLTAAEYQRTDGYL